MELTGLVSSFFSIIRTISIADVIDVAIVTYLVFTVMKLLNKTRATPLLNGVALIFFGYIIASQFQLKTVTFLIESLLQVGFIALLVVFQPELRRALEQVGSGNLFSLNIFHKRTVEEVEVDRLRKAIAGICDAMETMSEKKTGALIVMENFTTLDGIKQSGTVVNADITPELIGTVFYDGSPLHDGAMIISNDRIKAAGCILPVSHDTDIPRALGLRHRSALGISQATDAVAIVVSEETGNISLAYRGNLDVKLSNTDLEQKLSTLMA